MRSACSLPAADVCWGGREEAVSIQLGQPYSEGIRHVIQPLRDSMRSGGRTGTNHGEGAHSRMFAYTVDLPPLWAGPIRWPCQAKSWGGSSSQKAPGFGSEHICVQEQRKMQDLRNTWLQPTQARAGSIYSAMHGHTTGLIRCKFAHEVVLLKHQVPNTNTSLHLGEGHKTAQTILACFTV